MTMGYDDATRGVGAIPQPMMQSQESIRICRWWMKRSQCCRHSKNISCEFPLKNAHHVIKPQNSVLHGAYYRNRVLIAEVCYDIWTQHNYMLKPATSLFFILKKTIKSNGSSTKHILISAFPRQLSRFAGCQHVSKYTVFDVFPCHLPTTRVI